MGGYAFLARGKTDPLASLSSRCREALSVCHHCGLLGKTDGDNRLRAGRTLLKACKIEFRAEIPSDFDCGEPVTDPVPLPPILQTEASEFFNPDGTARFSTKYTKGC